MAVPTLAIARNKDYVATSVSEFADIVEKIRSERFSFDQEDHLGTMVPWATAGLVELIAKALQRLRERRTQKAGAHRR